ncbi:hypothetical protein J3F83DRAFT_653267 [Trichoderma novae-zelandiae]
MNGKAERFESPNLPASRVRLSILTNQKLWLSLSIVFTEYTPRTRHPRMLRVFSCGPWLLSSVLENGDGLGVVDAATMPKRRRPGHHHGRAAISLLDLTVCVVSPWGRGGTGSASFGGVVRKTSRGLKNGLCERNEEEEEEEMGTRGGETGFYRRNGTGSEGRGEISADTNRSSASKRSCHCITIAAFLMHCWCCDDADVLQESVS